MNAAVRNMADSTAEERVYYLETATHCNSLFQNMRDLQQSRTLCDVTVRVGHEEYFAHRVILVAASQYFRDELLGQMKPNITVNINLPPLSFQLVLEYIYTGKLSITSKNVVDLIVASKYLKMDTLEAACHEAMSTLLSLSTLSLDTTKGQNASSSSDDKYSQRVYAKKKYSSYIFATGGWNRLYDEMSECEKYNPRTNMWQPIASMHSKRQQHAVIGFYRRLYAFGGWGEEAKLSSVEYYDPNKDAWTLATPLPHERSGHAICSLNGSIFICGGQNKDNDILRTVEQFDPLIDRYKPCPPMNTERAYFKMAAIDACIYAIGGWNPESLDSVERFDPREGRWYPAPSMGVKRTEHGVTVLNDYIYCTGGDGTMRCGERLDIRRDKWEPIPDMNTDRVGHELVTMNGSVYAIGGHLFEKFDPLTNRWFQMQRTLKERYHLGASVLYCI